MLLSLRQRRKTTAHLFALKMDLRIIARKRGRHRDSSTRLLAFLEAAALGIRSMTA